jgi:hypothetical protein
MLGDSRNIGERTGFAVVVIDNPSSLKPLASERLYTGKSFGIKGCQALRSGRFDALKVEVILG